MSLFSSSSSNRSSRIYLSRYRRNLGKTGMGVPRTIRYSTNDDPFGARIDLCILDENRH